MLTVVLCLGVFAGSAITTGCSSQPPGISIEGQYAVLSPLFVGAGSIFMKIVNAGGADALVNAKAGLPGTLVELHDVQDGKMRKVGRIAIPPAAAVELRPMGLHIMIFKMPKEIKSGSDIVLTLTFEKSGEKQVPVKFTPPGDRSGHMQH